MVYLILLGAVISYSLQNIPNKKYQQLCGVGLVPSMALIITSGTISLVLFFALSGFRLEFFGPSVAYAAAFSLIGMTGTPAQLKALELGSLSTVLIYTLIGCSVIPFVYGAVFLQEEVTVWKLLALVLMCVSFLFKGLHNAQGKKAQGKDRWVYLGCCLCCFFSNGICSILLKLNQITPALSVSFLLWCGKVFFLFWPPESCWGRFSSARARRTGPGPKPCCWAEFLCSADWVYASPMVWERCCP